MALIGLKVKHNALAWISPNEIEQYDFCPADQAMIQKMMEG